MDSHPLESAAFSRRTPISDICRIGFAAAEPTFGIGPIVSTLLDDTTSRLRPPAASAVALDGQESGHADITLRTGRLGLAAICC